MDKDTLVRELSSRLSESRVLWQPKDLVAYSRDSSFYSQLHELLPDVVVLPASAGEVAALVAFANEAGVPVTPRGAATGQTCGGLAAHGGIVVDMSALRRIVEVDALNLQVIAEPGVVHADLNARLAQDRLFFPPDPGSSKMCTLGGMVSNNSRGMRAIKYGATGDYVLGMEVVLPDGPGHPARLGHQPDRPVFVRIRSPQVLRQGRGHAGHCDAAPPEGASHARPPRHRHGAVRPAREMR